MNLPPYIPWDEIQQRLSLIFPQGTPNRLYCTREIAAKTVFAMLYVGAVQGTGRSAGPKHVYRMSDDQAVRTSEGERLGYGTEALKAGFVGRGTPWYADTTREPIRDETLRNGLIAVGAARDDKQIATTSSKPRYTLDADFAALLDPSLAGDALDLAIKEWQAAHLSVSALATITLYRAGALTDPNGMSVHFPNGETRRMGSGLSSLITKEVIEGFARRFLSRPAVLWVSESGKKVVQRDDVLAKRLGLNIDPARNLPDVILIDADAPKFLIVFVEIVATDGPITALRRGELLAIAAEGGFAEDQVAFVTAYLDRDHPAFKRTFSTLAWNSFAWLASDPQHIVALMDTTNVAGAKLLDLLTVRRGT